MERFTPTIVYYFTIRFCGCPCSKRYKKGQPCKCTPRQVEQYLGKVSGPMLDRMDIHIEVPDVPYEKLADKRDSTSSQTLREAVIRARQRQLARFDGSTLMTNGRMSSRQVRQHCKLDEQGGAMLKQAYNELGLSARAHDKICKVARTIADIEDEAHIHAHHIAEAIQYRRLDRYF